jgi:hypothetical protein
VVAPVEPLAAPVVTGVPLVEPVVLATPDPAAPVLAPLAIPVFPEATGLPDPVDVPLEVPVALAPDEGVAPPLEPHAASAPSSNP